METCCSHLFLSIVCTHLIICLSIYLYIYQSIFFLSLLLSTSSGITLSTPGNTVIPFCLTNRLFYLLRYVYIHISLSIFLFICLALYLPQNHTIASSLCNFLSFLLYFLFPAYRNHFISRCVLPSHKIAPPPSLFLPPLLPLDLPDFLPRFHISL